MNSKNYLNVFVYLLAFILVLSGITACGSSGNSEGNSVPAIPKNLYAEDTPSDQGGSVNLAWTPSVSGDVTEQRLYRATSTGGPYSLIAAFTNNTAANYIDSGLTDGTPYHYIVRAWDGVNESADSNEAITVPVDNIALISISKIGTGSGNVTSNTAGIDCGNDCLEEYPTGTEVTLTPVPYPGASFSGWSGEEDCGDGSITMDTDKSCVAIFSQKTWANTYGGEGADWPSTIQQTSDGGYIVAGSTDSFGGNGDIWVIKLDGNGDVLWQKTYYGGEGWGWLGVFIQQTKDGNYIMAGTTEPSSYGYGDVWVMKLNVSGEILWQKTYGGEGWEWVSSIRQTSDDGYVVVSSTTDPVNDSDNVWVIKLDENGTVQWQKSYGGEGWEWPSSIQQTTDGGYIVAGYISDTADGYSDALVIKLNESGVVEWIKRYAGEGSEWPSSIQQTSDGGYIVAGDTSDDAWVMKLDNSGAEIWQKAYGGSGYEWATSIQQINEGGYIVAGSSSDPSGDAWVMNLDANGSVIWLKSYGGDGIESASAIQQTSEGGYILAGSTASFGAGNDDLWILKLDADGDVAECMTGVNIPVVSSVETKVISMYSIIDVPPNLKDTDVSITVPEITGDDSNAIPVTWCSGVPGEGEP